MNENRLLTSQNKNWTPEEDDILRQYAIVISDSDISKLYLPHRPRAGIEKRRLRLGICHDGTRKDWTEEEEALLLQHGNAASPTDLQAEYFPHRSISSIQGKKTSLGLLRHSPQWTQPEIELVLKYGTDLTAEELKEEYLPNRTASSIRIKRRRLGIKPSTKLKSRIARNGIAQAEYPYKIDQTLGVSDLSPTTYQILVGSILGDGFVTHRTTSGKAHGFIFRECHALDQEDYLHWKMKMLELFHPCLGAVRPRDKGTQQSTVSFQTASSPIFEQIRNDFYGLSQYNTWRKVLLPEQWLDKLDPLGLLIWYLDDGTCDLRTNVLSNHSIGVKLFDMDDLIRVTDSLNERYNLNLKIYTTKWNNGENKTISIPAHSRDVLLPIWSQYFEELNIPDCMRYKVFVSSAKKKKRLK